ncbi:MAG: hypothetical protein FWF36_08030 [Propionibacteriaceae bacterium]|nr:hypothetical protein [Propionibacteriaceae bacterium]
MDMADATAFLVDAQAKLDGALLKWRTFGPSAEPVTDLSDLYGTSFFCRMVDMPEIAPRFISQQGYWVLGVDGLPLVEWSVGRERAAVLSEGRLYFQPKSVVDGMLYEDKAPSFTAFADALFKLARKRTQLVVVDGRKVRIGPSAANRVAGGSLRLG